MRKLIINADDFGPNPRVCDAIVEGLTTETISSTSVIANFEALQESVRPLVEGRFSCGIHLNVFSGAPVLEVESVPSLVDSSLQFRGAMPLTVLRDAIKKEHLKVEFRAQIERLLATGVHVTHIDNHRPEIYCLPDHFQVVIDLANEYRLPLRFPYRTFPSEGLAKMSAGMGIDRNDLASIASRFENEIVSRNVRCTDYFLPLFLNSPIEEQHYIQLLSSLPEGSFELCVHPSIEAGRGLNELTILRKFSRRRLREEFNIDLVSYAELS